jgi:hypothetical protein
MYIRPPPSYYVIVAHHNQKETEMRTMQAMPAYGRDYMNSKEAQADYAAGKDFRCARLSGGLYFSRRDEPGLKGEGFEAIEFYNLKGEFLGLRKI